MSPEEIQAEKARRAMLGIPGEKSGRPSIKDMEKEIMDKMRAQRLREERVRSEIDVRGVSCLTRDRIQLMCSSDWKTERVSKVQAGTDHSGRISQSGRVSRSGRTNTAGKPSHPGRIRSRPP